MTLLLRMFLLLGISLLASACATQLGRRTVSLPTLPGGPVEMRVAYAVNPRLPRMDAQELDNLLQAMRDAVLEHFGIQLRFAPVQVVPMATLFDTIPPARRAAAQRDIYDFKSAHSDRQRLARAFGRGLREDGDSLDGMLEFARPFTGPIAPPSFDTLGARIASLQLERIEQWRGRRALDGDPAINDTPYNEFMLWSALGYGDVPFELVLTNQIIASVEFGWPAVHTAVRGGYSNGITTPSQRSRFGTMSIWSTYAFSADDDAMVQLRGGERYSPQEAARLAGLSGAHEIGHQLLHLMHPFGNPACLMNPVPLFAYRAWADKLAAAQCPLGSSPAMTPGAYKGFVY